ncbi:hypothetical protein PMAYCL1PPCAC_13370, partial [Pristionchus mayeri]
IMEIINGLFILTDVPVDAEKVGAVIDSFAASDRNHIYENDRERNVPLRIAVYGLIESIEASLRCIQTANQQSTEHLEGSVERVDTSYELENLQNFSPYDYSVNESGVGIFHSACAR